MLLLKKKKQYEIFKFLYLINLFFLKISKNTQNLNYFANQKLYNLFFNKNICKHVLNNICRMNFFCYDYYIIIYNFEPYNFMFNDFNINSENFIYNKKFNNYKNIIFLKKFSGFLKKSDTLGTTIFNRLNNFYANSDISSDFLPKITKIKNLDFTRQSNLIFKHNSNNVNYFLNKKLVNNKKFKRNKNLLKKKKLFFFNYFNFNIINILTHSDFFRNKNDANFFLINGFLYVNNKIVTQNKILRKKDFIQLNFDKFYYLYYKNSIKKNVSFTTKFLKKYWLFDKTKLYFYKRKFNVTPPKFFNFMHFNQDIYNFLEIDYLSMCIFIVFKPLNLHYLNFYNFNFFNIYLSRLYLWKRLN